LEPAAFIIRIRPWPNYLTAESGQGRRAIFVLKKRKQEPKPNRILATMHHLATLRICQLDDQNRPVGYASGCIIRYREMHFLLTVAHATGNQGSWAVEIDFDPKEGKARLLPLGGMGFLSVFRTNKGNLRFSREMDFSYKLLREPVPQPRFQILSEHGVIISRRTEAHSADRTIFKA